ncbi:MAG: deoxyhypusine synthase [Candidatus Anstonellales archaeon]
MNKDMLENLDKQEKNIIDIHDFNSYIENSKKVGFQATQLGRARAILRSVIAERKNYTIFLGFTANLVASGLRGYLASLVKKGLVDVIVTTGGGIDHDVIRCFMDYQVGDFDFDDKELHDNSINRIGNILVHNKCYEKLEQISNQVLVKLIELKRFQNSPSELIYEYSKYVYENSKDENSILRACYEKNINIYSPGITDSAIGLNIYFFKKKKKDYEKLSIDVTKDMNELANKVLNAEKTFGLILGGGITKHHILGVNLLRNGLDKAIYITTSNEFDGSLSGARTREAISWGKIKSCIDNYNHVTIHGDASIILPVLLYNLI